MTEYERDYTAFQNADGIYMAKGLVQNIDEIIDYMRLPLPVLTTLYPFQGKIVYNGLISPLEVKIDDQATEAFLKEYRDGNRVYSLKQRVKH